MSTRIQSYRCLTGASPFSSARSRPIRLERASSAPARSIEDTATSTSASWITCSMGSRCTSTSNIDRVMSSGLKPWLIVRFPCGSMSTIRTRFLFRERHGQIEGRRRLRDPPLLVRERDRLRLGRRFRLGLNGEALACETLLLRGGSCSPTWGRVKSPASRITRRSFALGPDCPAHRQCAAKPGRHRCPRLGFRRSACEQHHLPLVPRQRVPAIRKRRHRACQLRLGRSQVSSLLEPAP